MLNLPPHVEAPLDGAPTKGKSKNEASCPTLPYWTSCCSSTTAVAVSDPPHTVDPFKTIKRKSSSSESATTIKESVSFFSPLHYFQSKQSRLKYPASMHLKHLATLLLFWDLYHPMCSFLSFSLLGLYPMMSVKI